MQSIKKTETTERTAVRNVPGLPFVGVSRTIEQTTKSDNGATPSLETSEVVSIWFIVEGHRKQIDMPYESGTALVRLLGEVGLRGGE